MSTRPELTFPNDVADYVRAAYSAAGSVLEYGSGGSTVLAAEMGCRHCFSVESDKSWASNLQTWIDANVPGHNVRVHYSYIGATREWGWPQTVRKSMVAYYRRYQTSVWRRADFVHPDVILIDGRFRVGCFLAAIARISRDTTILFDDYTERNYARTVEQFFTPVEYVGRMAKFHVSPRPLSISEQLRFAKSSLLPS